MPYKDKRTNKWHARLQYDGKRYSLGTWPTKRQAEAIEAEKYMKLRDSHDDIMRDVPLEYEETPVSFLLRELKSLFARFKAQRKQDKDTTRKLEEL